MKILIHSTTLDGEPLEADGIALRKENLHGSGEDHEGPDAVHYRSDRP